VVDLDALVHVAIVGTALGLVQALFAATLLGFGFFDLLSVVFLDVAIGVPMVAAVVLTRGWWLARSGRGSACTRPAVVAAGLALVVCPLVAVYASRIEPRWLRLDEVTVPVPEERVGGVPLRVGVISDIQTVRVTDHERRAVDLLMDQEPDLVLVAGDIFQGTSGQYEATAPALRDLFQRMDAPGGAFVVLGNVDTVAGLRELTEGTPVEVLDDEIADVRVGDRMVRIGGVDLDPSPPGLAVVDALQSSPGDDLRILLAHHPDWILELAPDSRIDVVVAGHTHGGQVQLPLIGPLITMSHVPRSVASGGLSDHEGNAIFVTSGVGREQQGAPQIRFLARPSVAILTLTG
jgi:predicted MPP superfamily phosphohydrolase